MYIRIFQSEDPPGPSRRLRSLSVSGHASSRLLQASQRKTNPKRARKNRRSDGGALRVHVLGVVACGECSTRQALFFGCSWYSSSLPATSTGTS